MSYRLIALNGDAVVQLSWEYPYVPDTIIVADINDVDAFGTGCAINLPAANGVGTGVTLLFNNIGGEDAASFALRDSTGALLVTMAPGQVVSVYLTKNDTVEGSWVVIPFGNGQSAIATLTFGSTDSLITFTPNKTITNPGGTVNLTLDKNLSGLTHELIGKPPGYLVVTSTGVNVYTTRSIIAGANITIDNPAGVEGDTLINLDSSLTGLTSIAVGNYIIGGDTISTSNGGNILVNSPGAAIILNGVSIDAATSTITAPNLSVTGNFTNPGTAKGWCTFSDAFAPTSGSNVTVSSQYGVISSVIGTNGVFYTINFSTTFLSSYVVMVNLVRPFAATQVQFQAFVATQQPNHCIVYAMDINGNYLPATNGMMVAIFSN